MVSFKGHFDGKVIVPEEPLDLRANQQVLIVVESNKNLDPPTDHPPGLRPFGLCAGQFQVPDDFDASLPDDIISSFEG